MQTTINESFFDCSHAWGPFHGLIYLFEFSFDGGKTYTGTKTPLPSFINFENTHEASATFARDGRASIKLIERLGQMATRRNF